MKRKLQVVVSDEAWTILETLEKEANDDFNNGCITLSDIVNESILTAKVDIKSLQAKHTNIRKSLRWLAAQKDMDVETAIRNLMDLRSKGQRRPPKASNSTEEVGA